MWNICRAQCPTALIDRDLFGSRRRSAAYYSPSKAPLTSTPGGKGGGVFKPVSTLSPSFWLHEATLTTEKKSSAPFSGFSTIPLSKNTPTTPTPTPTPGTVTRLLTLNSGHGGIVAEQPKAEQLPFKLPNDVLESSPSRPTPPPPQIPPTEPPSESLFANPPTEAPILKMDQTEYKRSFVWSKPMVEPPTPKAEPMVSSYTLSFGGAGARSLDASGNQADGRHMPQSTFSSGSRSPTPGGMMTHDVAPLLCNTSNQQEEQSQRHPAGPERVGKGPSILFSYEPPVRAPSPSYKAKQSEYHSEFKPFDDYVYVEGEGKFKKHTAATKLVAAAAALNGATGASPPTVSANKAWFAEVEERSKQACVYRARSQNGATPINPEHPWDGHTVKDSNLAALALATRMIVEEKRAERKSRSSSAKPTSRSSGARLHLNSAPASLRDQHSADSSVKSAPPQARAVARKPPPSGTTDRNNNVAIVPGKPPLASAPKKSTPAPAKEAPKPAEAKVWLKPKKKTDSGAGNETKKEPTGRAVTKPVKAAPLAAEAEEVSIPIKVFDAQPKSVPLRTTQVKTPEDLLTGIKSPSPESWKVSIEKGGLNWVNGTTAPVPVNFEGKTNGGQGLVKPVPINASSNDVYGPLSA